MITFKFTAGYQRCIMVESGNYLLRGSGVGLTT